MPIRKANLGDLDSINGLLGYIEGYSKIKELLAAKFATLLGQEGVYVFLFELNTGVIGLAAVQTVFEIGMHKNTMLITYLVVDDRYRNEGVGKRLEQFCTSFAIERGCGRIQLHCSSDQTAAHYFYPALGYTESPKFYTKELE